MEKLFWWPQPCPVSGGIQVQQQWPHQTLWLLSVWTSSFYLSGEYIFAASQQPCELPWHGYNKFLFSLKQLDSVPGSLTSGYPDRYDSIGCTPVLWGRCAYSKLPRDLSIFKRDSGLCNSPVLDSDDPGFPNSEAVPGRDRDCKVSSAPE